METWQKSHIKKNLVELIKNTNCNVVLISRLQQNGILSQVDIEILQSTQKEMEKSHRLYHILLTRKNAYEKLLNALEEVQQTGASQILRNSEPEFKNCGLISVNTKHLIGKGQSGTVVYKGLFDRRPVAVKVICNQPDLAKKEVEILKKLDEHENVVRYYLAELNDKHIHIALELCLINLEDEVEKTLLNPDPYFVLESCTKGMAFLHKNGVVHRNLKPTNILLTRHGQVKISDFGLSKQLAINATSGFSCSPIMGTEEWMAPETLSLAMQKSEYKGRTTSTKADIFSLGCVFYFTLTKGQHLFGTKFERQIRILKNQPCWTTLIEDPLKTLISNMIYKVPEYRPSAERILKSNVLTVRRNQPTNKLDNKSAAEKKPTNQNSNENATKNELHINNSTLQKPEQKAKCTNEWEPMEWEAS